MISNIKLIDIINLSRILFNNIFKHETIAIENETYIKSIYIFKWTTMKSQSILYFSYLHITFHFSLKSDIPFPQRKSCLSHFAICKFVLSQQELYPHLHNTMIIYSSVTPILISQSEIQTLNTEHHQYRWWATSWGFFRGSDSSTNWKRNKPSIPIATDKNFNGQFCSVAQYFALLRDVLLPK